MRGAGGLSLGFLVFVGCVGDSPTSGVDAATDSSSTVDASGDVVDASTDAVDSGPPCDPTAPFDSNAQLVAGLSGAGVTRFSDDELTAFFDLSGDAGSLDIYLATRADRSSAFGPPIPLAFSSPTDTDYLATVSGDGLRLVFTRSISSPSFELRVSERPSTAAQFLASAPLVGPVNSAEWELFPYLLPSGAALYYVSSVAFADSYRIMRAASSSGSFGTPVAIAELNTTNELAPTPSNDELSIFWASARGDLSPKGGMDIYFASRTSTNQPFANLRNVSELNTAANDSPTWLSRDGCRLYFTRGGTGMMMSRRTK